MMAINLHIHQTTLSIRSGYLVMKKKVLPKEGFDFHMKSTFQLHVQMDSSPMQRDIPPYTKFVSRLTFTDKYENYVLTKRQKVVPNQRRHTSNFQSLVSS